MPVLLTIKEIGNTPLAFKNRRVLCSYTLPSSPSTSKISPENFKVQEHEKHSSPTLNQASDYKCFLYVP